jgi:sugar transferase EpsL
VSQEVTAPLAQRSALRISLVTRVFNLAIALPAIVLLSPTLTVVSALVRLKLGRPVLFKQQRAGFGGRPIIVYKFRTMTEAADATGKRLSDADRLTPFGSFLRSTSADELPELLNVLKGEMSLVGPRPLPTEYLSRYTPEQMRRHDVPPGITGWAQINGRNAVGWPDRFALDVWYVDHRSMSLDLRILALTVLKVLRREGISQPGRATSDKFYGNEEPATTGDQSRSR